MKSKNESQQIITQKVEEIALTADEFPGVIIIHNIVEKFNKIEYMSPRGAEILGVKLDELKKMGADYYAKFFNEEDAKDYVPKMIQMVERNNEKEIYSFFQQVRSSVSEPWTWYISSTRILLKDKQGMPLLSITFAVPIDPLHHLTNKVSRLLDENNFLRGHFKEFTKLSEREKEIAKELALGENAVSIADKLHITAETVKTHRKNIYRKLTIKSAHELSQYARAFDLI